MSRWCLVILLFSGVASSSVWAQRLSGRYIVELSTEPVAEHVARLAVRGAGLQSTAAQAHRALVRTEQATARTAVTRRQGVVLDSVENVANALFVQIPDSEAAVLATLPGVKRVTQERLFTPSLDRAVQVNHISDAWNDIGFDQGGAGMKVAIIDTGIDVSHPAFQGFNLAVPSGFPKLNKTSDTNFTNNKVIVARSYVSLLPSRDPDTSARDHVGHGTALAMITGGARNTGPLASIAGIAQQAQLGNYKVFGTPGYNDNATDSAILKAMDDAVADGMDVINLSLGSDVAPALGDDLEVQAIERAVSLGVIVVVAAGNNGPDYTTISSPATAPDAIAVGATPNGRAFAESVTVDGLTPAAAENGAAATSANPISGPLVDVATIDGNGLACNPLNASLSGQIALIERGTCAFETKLLNAQQAGAAGAVIYTRPESPDIIQMEVGSATLPAVMVAYSDGNALKQAAGGNPNATIDFTKRPVETNSARLTSFTAAGPSVDGTIKPDLVAVGQDIYMATQTYDQNGEMYDPTGYISADGTSFSTPMVAGTAALIKSARPGLTVAQYRSLLINNATVLSAGVQQAGAGALNAYASLHAAITATPTSLSFGAGGGSIQASQTLTITNVSGSDDTFQIFVAPNTDSAPAPSPGSNNVQIAAGGTASVPVNFQADGLAAGAYDGFIRIVSTNSGTESRVPYWYASTSTTPAHVTVLYNVGEATHNTVQTDAILVRITDSAGVPITGHAPTVTSLSGGGTVRSVAADNGDSPGAYAISVRLGAKAGDNVFEVKAGSVVVDLVITGQ